jgi:hypothetical protein
MYEAAAHVKSRICHLVVARRSLSTGRVVRGTCKDRRRAQSGKTTEAGECGIRAGSVGQVGSSPEHKVLSLQICLNVHWKFSAVFAAALSSWC